YLLSFPTRRSSDLLLFVASVISNCYVLGMASYALGGRRISLSCEDGRNVSDRVTGLNLDRWWLATVKSLPGNWPSYHAIGVRGRLRFDRSLPRRDYVSLRAHGLSGEA